MKKILAALFASSLIANASAGVAAEKFVISNNLDTAVKLSFEACYTTDNGIDCSPVQDVTVAEKASQIINLASENQYYHIISSQAVGSSGKMITGEYGKNCEGKNGNVLVFDNFRTNTIACVEAHG